MTAISVIYKKNTTGEEFPPIDRFRITYTRPDGKPATSDDAANIEHNAKRNWLSRLLCRLFDCYREASD